MAHRPQHKKECRKRAKEIHDQALFKQPPQVEDCPICFLRLPFMMTGYGYFSCCGKAICNGCVHAFQSMGNVTICPFCRTPLSNTDEETLERNNTRIKAEDAPAFYHLGSYYNSEHLVYHEKARDFYLRAGKLGSAKAYCNIGNDCFSDSGAGRDEKKALYYWELAAIVGCEKAR